MRTAHALALAALLHTSAAMYISVNAGGSKCYFEVLHVGDKFVGVYEEAVDGGTGIDVRISGPDDLAVFSATDKRSGRFEVTAQQSGEYQLCFNNHASSSNKIVSFATHIGENAPHDAATKESAEGVNSALQDLLMLTYEVNDAQRFMRTREDLRDDVSQTMASRVIIVAFAELVAILLVAYLQVRTLKSFFEVRTRI